MRVDYIIVGAGSAGCVLANRLTADHSNTCLVLEAGPSDWNPMIHMPAGIQKLLPAKWINWGYRTEPEEKLAGRRIAWHRAKVVGGCSSINAMIYTRGHALDYDQWQQMGNSGWGFDDLLPYFKKAEGSDRGDDAFHSSHGPLKVSQKAPDDPLFAAFKKACEQAGFKSNHDFNGADQEGVGTYDTTIHKGSRASAARSYLTPAKSRKNLTLKTKAMATRILFEGRKAIGIEYSKGGRTERAFANKEVILSGGAINSPQLLLLSGVGPADHLQEHNIDCIHHVPGVGQNLQDHLDCAIRFTIKEPISALKWNAPHRQVQVFFEWLLFGKGFGTFSAAPAGGFLKTDPSLERPDIQLHYVPALLNKYASHIEDRHGFEIKVCQLHPHSRGEIKLKSNNPHDHPLIYANYLSDPHDLSVLRRGVEIVRKIGQQPALSFTGIEEIWPGSDIKGGIELDNAIRLAAKTIWHPVGSCKMGIDDLAVVDTTLKVKGIENVRVVDASIMPTVVSGNTNAPTIMIAEKASDLILETA